MSLLLSQLRVGWGQEFFQPVQPIRLRLAAQLDFSAALPNVPPVAPIPGLPIQEFEAAQRRKKLGVEGWDQLYLVRPAVVSIGPSFDQPARKALRPEAWDASVPRVAIVSIGPGFDQPIRKTLRPESWDQLSLARVAVISVGPSFDQPMRRSSPTEPWQAALPTIVTVVTNTANWGWHEPLFPQLSRIAKADFGFVTVLPGMPPFGGPPIQEFEASPRRKSSLRESWDTVRGAVPTATALQAFDAARRRFTQPEQWQLPFAARPTIWTASPFDQAQKLKSPQSPQDWASLVFNPTAPNTAKWGWHEPLFPQLARIRKVDFGFAGVLPGMPAFGGPPVQWFEECKQRLRRIDANSELWAAYYNPPIVVIVVSPPSARSSFYADVTNNGSGPTAESSFYAAVVSSLASPTAESSFYAATVGNNANPLAESSFYAVVADNGSDPTAESSFYAEVSPNSSGASTAPSSFYNRT